MNILTKTKKRVCLKINLYIFRKNNPWFWHVNYYDLTIVTLTPITTFLQAKN